MDNKQEKHMEKPIDHYNSSELDQNDVEEACHEGRSEYEMDVDRMVNEGLGGGQVTYHNGLIGHSTTDTMDIHEEEIE